MGREWLYKSSGGRKPPSTTTKHMNGKTRKDRNTSNSSSGCMSAIFNLFDIQHHHQFRFHHPSFLSESTINSNSHESNFALQGVEAPRNSLESPESPMDVVAPSSSSKVKELTNLNIPMSGIQIKTKRSRFPDDLSSECSSSSPGTKTPNLVARLMGLDLLPEYSSPRPSSSSTRANSNHHNRSLPTTPRLSTASRRSTDNDYQHHRLSLQLNKENYINCTDQQSVNNRKDVDLKSQQAKQIANQVRERISQRLGNDITNTVSPATRIKEKRKDSNLVLLKPKKQLAPALAPAPVSFPETVGKARLLNIKNNLNKPNISNSVKDKKIKRIVSERYDLRLKKINQQEEAYVSKIYCKKIKSTGLPNHNGVNVKNTTTYFSVKKEMTSSSSTTRLPQKQVSLVTMTQSPSNLNSYSLYKNQNDTHTLNLSPISVYQWQSPAAVSEVMENIDRLIAMDMGWRMTSTAVETEAEEIVKAIESEIVGALVHEMVVPAGSDRMRSHVLFT